MTQITQEEHKSALARISEQLDVARAALKAAEAISIETGVGFSFEIGDGYGYFETYEYDGKNVGYWDGWQGSSC
jgi:hypothetical protein